MMRLRRLSLDRFGHFTDHVLRFGPAAARADFHIVYGPNEAGKTTTMEAALRLFYGFQHVEPYAFKHQRANLQVSAEVEIDGTPRSFTRLPKRSGTLVDGHGNPVPEAALAAHLGGMAEADYRNLLCLDDATIEQGGEEIMQARGDVGRLLFSAAAGVAHLSKALDGLRTEATEIWRKKASKTRIAALKRDLAEVEKEIRAQDVTASAWQALKKAAVAAGTAEKEARAARNAVQADAATLEGKRRALPLVAELDALRAEIAPFEAYPDRLGFELEDLVTLKTDHDRAEADIARLEQALTDLAEHRAALALSPSLVALSEDLDRLDDLRARDLAAALDLPRRRDQLAEAENAMVRAARDLGAPEGCDPGTLVPSHAQMVALDTARDQLRSACAALAAERQEVSDLAASRDSAAVALNKLAENRTGRADLGAILARHDADTLMPAHAAALQAIASAEQAAREALDRLAHPGTQFDTLPYCAMTPQRARDLAEQHDVIAQTLAQDTAARDAHCADAAARQAQAETLLHDGGLCSDDRLAKLRRTRDAQWARHQNALTATTAQEFEAAMHALDAAQEARIAHAADLGQLRQIGQARAEAEARAEQAEARLASHLRARDALLAQVTDAAAQAGLHASVRPDEWLDWVQRHAAAQQAEMAAAAMRNTHAVRLAQGQALLEALVPHLDMAAPDLSGAVAAARRVAQTERSAREARDAAKERLQQATERLEKRTERLSTCEQAVARAEASWQGAVTAALGGAVAAAPLLATLDPVRDLVAQNAARADAAQRVHSMERDRAQFADAVAALIAAHGLNACDTPADSFAKLRAASEGARAAAARAQDLDGRIAEARTARDAARQRLDEIARTVAAHATDFPPGADVGTLDALRATAQHAVTVIAQRDRKAALARDILSELGADTLASARAMLEGESLASLEVRAERCKTELAQAEQRVTEATEARVTAQQAQGRITGDASVASLTERRATLELQLQDAARDFLELSLGHRLADTAIRRYRDTHRSGMMAATERCFAALTQGAYARLTTQPDGAGETLLAVDGSGTAKRVTEMSKGTRFQLYLALRAAAHEQLVAQGTCLPFFCDDIFETFDEHRTRAACRVMEQIGRSGQAIYLTHHRHVVEIAQQVCDTPPIVHEI